MIGNAKKHGGLYYFEDGQSLSTFVGIYLFIYLFIWFPFQLSRYYVMAFLVRSSQFSLFEKIVPNIICESSLGLNNLTKKGGGGG